MTAFFLVTAFFMLLLHSIYTVYNRHNLDFWLCRLSARVQSEDAQLQPNVFSRHIRSDPVQF